MATDSDEYLAILKASYDYDPQSEDGIAVKQDQLLFLLERVDEDWWKVKAKGDSQDEDSPSGLVPAAYVEPAEHISVVKALYDYSASAPGELSVTEGEVLLVFDKDDWLLVQSQKDGGKAGFVPGNYVEEFTGEEPTTHSTPQKIVIPPSPPRPAYQDPADRVASAKVKADDIRTWAVSELDRKGKKKKGTLGIGNGAVFFASESDKTPVQKWQTADIDNITTEKSKHVHIDVGGANPIHLRFNVGSKDTADAIVSKLESSKAISAPGGDSEQPSGSLANGNRSRSPPARSESASPHKAKKNGASVHFSPGSPTVIPQRSDDEEEEEDPQHEQDGVPAAVAQQVPKSGSDTATALYDFDADGEDELSVKEGDHLIILEKDGDDWWKCRNAVGAEGVVPASYLESGTSEVHDSSVHIEEDEEDLTAAREAEEARARLERERAAEEARRERERKRIEMEQRAKVEAERKRLEKERAITAEEAQRKSQEREVAEERTPAPRKSQSGSSRTSSDGKHGPPPEKTRVWHDRTGQFRVEAAFLGFNNGKLRLHKVNGVVIEVPSEKMSNEDMKFIEKLMKKSAASSVPASSVTPPSDDDKPLAEHRKSLPASASRTKLPKPTKAPAVDWFDFFLSAGCDIDDCTRYASSFERDKIDESILLDITDATMRSLGLREGDIIRVTKAIEARKPQVPKGNGAILQGQPQKDDEFAMQSRLDENDTKGKVTSPPPNLFAGPGGALKNNTQRRGRPQPSKSLPPPNVDLNSISTASDQILRTSTPQLVNPAPPRTSSTPVQPPSRTGSALTSGGFDDDAWTNRPSSTRPLAPTPTAGRAPSVPPVSSPPTATAPTLPAPTPPPQPQLPAAQPQRTGSSLAKTTESDIFDQLSRLSQLRTQSPALATPTGTSPAITSAPPVSFQSGLGMRPSPIPMGQLQSQQTGFSPQQPQLNGPRGPFAPVPANQGLLQPLVPTTTGFNSFIPVRPASAPFQPQPAQPSFFSSQPTGFQPTSQPLLSQPTGFPSFNPMLSQPTGLPSGVFGQGTTFQNTGSFGAIQSNPTGFNPGFGQSPYNNNTSPPPVPPLPSSAINTTSPANVFAQMKSGTFGNESTNPQPSDKYDALRPNPIIAQQTGWDFPSNNGFQGGYMYQR